MTTSVDNKTTTAGSWLSPLTSKRLSQAGIRLSQPTIRKGTYYWLEGRPAERGRTVLVQCDKHGVKSDLTPPPYDVRSRAHEYGGGSYLVCAAGIFFVNAGDQGLYRLSKGRVTPVFNRDHLRLADMIYDAPRNRVIAIAEDHSSSGEPENFLCGIRLEDGGFEALHRGADFYSSPALSNDSSRLSWLSWMHPNLPWDATRLHVSDLDDTHPTQTETQLLDDIIVRQGEAIFQPCFGPDDRLYFVSDRDGWWNLYAARDVTGTNAGTVAQLTREHADFGMAQWIFGMSLYGFSDADTIVAARVIDGLWDVVLVELESGQLTPVAPWPFNTIDHLVVSGTDCVCIAGNATQENAVISLDFTDNTTVPLQTASPAAWAPELISHAQSISFKTSQGDTARGFYYAPRNPQYTLHENETPPLIVMVHGGPTTASTASLNPRLQFWTTRGFAVLDVNYRGSTGYGRDYRRKLDGAWGQKDVDDCVFGARHLVATGRANPEQLFIMGGSAGGYTVLCALAFTKVFQGGISLYGIGDLAVLANDTHKFEARYSDRLIGPFDAALYRDRSPLFAADNITAPALFFQGTEDKVVPPNQTEDMVNALRSRQVPVAYVSMEGEGHGFRRSDSIERMLDCSLTFLCRLCDCTPAGGATALEIYNDDQLHTG